MRKYYILGGAESRENGLKSTRITVVQTNMACQNTEKVAEFIL